MSGIASGSAARIRMKFENLLMVADSERDANMLYAARLFLSDPFIYLCVQGQGYIVIPDFELERVRKRATQCRVLSWNRFAARLRRDGIKSPGFAHVIHRLLSEKKLSRIHVPPEFPYALARELRQLDIKVRLCNGPFFPQRQFKSRDELKKISAALMMAEVGLAEALQALKNSRIARNRSLLFHNVPLTSEKLRAIIETAILQAGGRAAHTIVAGGRQACNPHEPGNGPLRAHEPIVIDIFPRSQKTGYFGDITRTVVRGRASEPIRKMYDTVARGQAVAFSKLHPGTKTVDVHTAVRELFEREGYRTGRQNGQMQGFFHGTGHGLGLEVHESPRLSATSTEVLQPGHVVTVEPGLYYHEWGAVRLEDVAHVSCKSPRNLTKFEKILEL
jgi:Xaa-Pro aminopeptidase